MAKFRMEDGSVVDTERAAGSWEEATRWDGRNHISVNTGSQWTHQTLYRSRKGRFYVVHSSQCQGSLPSAEYVSDADAARWLLVNEEELPADLAHYAEAIEE